MALSAGYTPTLPPSADEPDPCALLHLHRSRRGLANQPDTVCLHPPAGNCVRCCYCCTKAMPPRAAAAVARAAAASGTRRLRAARDAVVAAAREVAAAGTWLQGSDAASSMAVLQRAHQDVPGGLALLCAADEWQALVVALAQLYTLSLRALEPHAEGHPRSASASALPLSWGPCVQASWLINAMLSAAGACGAQAAGCQAAVAAVVLASGTLQQLSRLQAVSLRQLHMSYELCQQQGGPHEEAPAQPPAQHTTAAAEERMSIFDYSCVLLSIAASCISMVLESPLNPLGGSARAHTAAWAALADSQLLDHMAASVTLGLCRLECSGSSSSSSSSSSSRYEQVYDSRAGLRNSILFITRITNTAAALPAACMVSCIQASAAGVSTSQGVSAGGAGAGPSAGVNVAARRVHRAGRDRLQRRQQQQQEAGQSMPFGLAVGAGTAAAAAQCLDGSGGSGGSGHVGHTWAEDQQPPCKASGIDDPAGRSIAPSPTPSLTASHMRVLGSPMLQTLLAVQLRLAVHALEGAEALPAAEASAERAAALAGRLSWVMQHPDQMDCVLDACSSLMCTLRDSSNILKGPPSASSPAGPFGEKPPAASGDTGALACSPGQVAGPMASSAAPALGDSPFTPQPGSTVCMAGGYNNDVNEVRR